MSLANKAQACISLKYKYDSMLSCVQNQRPELLNDPILNTFLVQIDAFEKAFEERVYALAGDENEYDT